MTFFSPQNSIGLVLEINKDFPQGWDEFLLTFVDTYRDIANAVNNRVISINDTGEIPSGQKYFPITASEFSSRVYRDGFRQVYNIVTSNPAGLVASPGTTLIPHGITFPVPNTFHFPHIYGGVESLAAGDYAPLPNGDITVRLDTTNIRISGYPAFYNGFLGTITLEYSKN